MSSSLICGVPENEITELFQLFTGTPLSLLNGKQFQQTLKKSNFAFKLQKLGMLCTDLLGTLNEW
jgi:hypothetical protein